MVPKHPTGGRGEGIRVLPTSLLLSGFDMTVSDLENAESRTLACRRATSSFHVEMIQKEVYPPLLIHGSTFHVRTYLLIVSTDPYVVLFRKGFALRNLHPYTTYVPGETE
ncbi:tubulin--tyrosine ligase family protein, partial [Patescibacteria group bacterium]|nr:tubulin--tyrosine ligase family protein [Patescibacteria group bacterium]